MSQEKFPDISQFLAQNKNESFYGQIHRLFEKLNEDDTINTDSPIDVKYPLRLNSENVQFIIYDTPGSDSNNEVRHIPILKNALKKQRNSIVVFVIPALWNKILKCWYHKAFRN